MLPTYSNPTYHFVTSHSLDGDHRCTTIHHRTAYIVLPIQPPRTAPYYLPSHLTSLKRPSLKLTTNYNEVLLPTLFILIPCTTASTPITATHSNTTASCHDLVNASFSTTNTARFPCPDNPSVRVEIPPDNNLLTSSPLPTAVPSNPALSSFVKRAWATATNIDLHIKSWSCQLVFALEQ